MEILVIARHGESVYSRAGVVNGDPGRPGGLTDRGRHEAAELGRALAAWPIDLAVVSPFPRTVETADVALAGREVPRRLCPDLAEIRFGAFEGAPVEVYRAFVRQHPLDTPLPGGGESQVEAARRYVAAYRRLLARPEATLLVVTHGLPLGLLLNAAEGLAPLPVAGRDVPLATPFRFDRAALAAAVERIEDWLQAYATRDGRGG